MFDLRCRMNCFCSTTPPLASPCSAGGGSAAPVWPPSPFPPSASFSTSSDPHQAGTSKDSESGKAGERNILRMLISFVVPMSHIGRSAPHPVRQSFAPGLQLLLLSSALRQILLQSTHLHLQLRLLLLPAIQQL